MTGNKNRYQDEWMETYTGGKFHFIHPIPEEVKIRDIAHHLSLLCRYTGACGEFYSVAEHSIRCSFHVPEWLRLAALLHDAAEAYIGDISRPVKYSHKLEETEAIITAVIDKKYGIDSHHILVKEADEIMLATEARDLMSNTTDWEGMPEPLEEIITPISSQISLEKAFLACFVIYGGKSNYAKVFTY